MLPSSTPQIVGVKSKVWLGQFTVSGRRVVAVRILASAQVFSELFIKFSAIASVYYLMSL